MAVDFFNHLYEIVVLVALIIESNLPTTLPVGTDDSIRSVFEFCTTVTVPKKYLYQSKRTTVLDFLFSSSFLRRKKFNFFSNS